MAYGFIQAKVSISIKKASIFISATLQLVVVKGCQQFFIEN
jgi:hypothetical protein